MAGESVAGHEGSGKEAESGRVDLTLVVLHRTDARREAEVRLEEGHLAVEESGGAIRRVPKSLITKVVILTHLPVPETVAATVPAPVPATVPPPVPPPVARAYSCAA